MGVRIWFSRIWPCRMYLIPLLRGNPDRAEVRVFGTHSDPAAPALRACDVVGPEPVVGDEAFFDFAIDFCRRHGIDVVMPSERIAGFADRVEAFARVGTRVMCSPAETVRIAASKSRTYAAAEDWGIPLAPWRAVRDAGSLLNAVEEISRPGRRVCVKPVGQSTSSGFRILQDSPLEISDSGFAPCPRASVNEVADALKRAEDGGGPVPELIVMPYLHPPEFSVDCLSDTTGAVLSAVVRAKEDRIRTLLDDPELTALARRAVGHFGLAYLSNVQFRHWDGRPVLLDVNARASAGLYQTAVAGVNLAWAAVRMLLYGDPGDVPEPEPGGRLVVVNHAIEVHPGW